MRILVAACLVLFGFSLHAADEERYPVDLIVVKYNEDNPKYPLTYNITDQEVTLSKVPGGLAAKGQGQNETMHIYEIGLSGPVYLYKSALIEISKTILDYLRSQGLSGVKVYVDPSEIGMDGKDLRPSNTTTLTYLVTVKKVEQVRTVGKTKNGNEIDAKKHNHLKRDLPVKPGDQLAIDETEDHIFYLNRHPNRRVDLEVGSLGVPDVTTVDLVISEDKPWRMYATVANTGPITIEEWQENIGFVNTQLTGFDDILVIDLATDSGNQYYSALGSYSRPFASYRRLRWNLEGTYRRFSAAQFAFNRRRFTGNFYEALYGLDWNFYQKKEFFADLFFNAQYNYVSVDNRLIELKGHQDFVIPQGGFRLVRTKPTSTLFFETDVEGPINGLTGVSQTNLNKLGRFDVSKNWAIWSGTAFGSVYLESLFHGDEYRRLANEIFAYTQWQYAFNNRLIPEYESVIGGLYSVRGYPSAMIAGDKSIVGSFEYRLHVPQLFVNPYSAETRVFGKPYRLQPQHPGGYTDIDFIIRAFFDIGSVGVKQSSVSWVPRDPTGTLMGTGVGAELIFRQNIFLRGDFAWAVHKVDNPAVENIKVGHFEPYFSLTVMY